MPYTTPVPGTTITAAYAIANIRDQAVTPFASAAARTSAITAPVQGMLSYLNDKNRHEAYDGALWVPVPQSAAIVKAADQAQTSTITLIDDTDLVLPLSANATYELDTNLFYVANTSGGLKVSYTFPVGASLTWGEDGYVIGGSFTMIRNSWMAMASAAQILAVEGAGGGTTVNARFTGILTVGSTAGSLRLQWAQNTSNAVATTVRAGSIMRLTRIS